MSEKIVGLKSICEEYVCPCHFKLDEMRKVLKDIEWKAYDTTDDVKTCPSCDMEEHHGHNPDCPVGLLLHGSSQGGNR